MSRGKSGMGGGSKPKSPHAKPHSMHIKRAHSGGFVVTHHSKPSPGGMGSEPTEHVVPDVDQLQQHLAENMGDQPPAGTMPEAPAQGQGPAQGM